MLYDSPQLLPITEIITENPSVKTFYFNHELKSKPGQFIMLWVPEVDQKPFSIGYADGKKFALTVFNRGPLTAKLFTLQIGDRVGITGPYGTNFTSQDNTQYIMVAGGYGAAPLGYLAEALQTQKGVTIDFLIGAQSTGLLLFEERLAKLPNLKLHIATDDGSKGHKGYVTDLLKDLIKEKSLVCTCGPELMEKTVLDICNQHETECEISIERYMKCGLGVCGQCAVDDLGICMCTEGPVVKRDLANQIKEFGVYQRDKSGAKINF